MESNGESKFFDTYEEMEQAMLERDTKRQWRRWALDVAVYPSLDICPYPKQNNCKYEVPLFKADCDFPTFIAWLGRWTEHLQKKGWMAYKDLWDFVDASQDIFRRGAQ